MSLVFNLVILVQDVFWKDATGSSMLVVSIAISANLLARFMLDLRSINEQGSNKSRTMSSINFDIRSLGGNIGAPLEIEDSTWATGPADDVVNDHDHQSEEAVVPFRAGLGLDIEEGLLKTVHSAGCEASSSRIEGSADVASDGNIP
ncbi:hypothetical protein EIP91_003882 [Steccherinum ochraceum]|uniref:Uncharacterized protein n=1 Tax=Steccherinum ochraceum TaxID=92696 RepID=A0A4R0RC93_9APHY|nr:hypothetical protein EIP91_003882 [Steccherinum ochraceum]